MSDLVNPSVNRPAEAFLTAGAIAYGGGNSEGWIVRGSSPSELAIDSAAITEGNLNTFAETSSGASLNVDIDPGEAFIFGAWTAIDVSTSVTLDASTANQTVYVGWDTNASNRVIVGLDVAFDATTPDIDKKIPLYDFDTDGTGVTSVTDRRTIGKTLDGRFVSNTSTVTSNYTTDGEQLLFADTSGSPVTITLSSEDLDDGSNVIIVDSGGNAGTNAITLDTEGSETINGSASVTIDTEYSAKAVASDGSNWFTSGAGGGGGGSFTDNDGDFVAELITDYDGIQFSDGEFIEFGTGSDFSVRYDSTNDDLRWQDKTNTADRMALDRTTGDLSIEGTITEGSSL